MSALYVFVDIKFDWEHFVAVVKQNFSKSSKLIIVATIQFASSLHVRNF
jgi:diphthamide biosynthesis enzyme Dph1/Dph2-like protein